MNSQIKNWWIEALRSNQYNQGTNCLSKIENNKCFHCCLGVLCELAKTHGVVSKSYNERNDIFSYNQQHQILPEEVVQWARLPNTNPNCEYKGEIVNLATLNDKYRLSFSEIANIIKEQL